MVRERLIVRFFLPFRRITGQRPRTGELSAFLRDRTRHDAGTMAVNQFAAQMPCLHYGIGGSDRHQSSDQGEWPPDSRTRDKEDGRNSEQSGKDARIARSLTPPGMFLERRFSRRHGMFDFFLLSLAGGRGNDRPERTERKQNCGEERKVPTAEEDGRHRKRSSNQKQSDGKMNHRRMKRFRERDHSICL